MGVVLAAAKLGEEAASRIGLPGFIGAVLAGMLLGGTGVGFVSEKDVTGIALLLGIGINFTLFLAGVEELSNPRLFKPTLRELAASSAMMAVAVLLLWAYTSLLRGLDAVTSLALALAVAMTSLGPLMKLVAEGGVGERELRLLRIGLVSEIAAITVFNSVSRGFNPVTAVATVAFVTVVLWLGRTLLSRALYGLERYLSVHEAPFAFIIALILTAGYLAEILGFNAAVTALLLGVFASDYLVKRPAYLERIRAFTFGFLEPLFFAGVGLYAVRPGATEVADIMVMLSILLLSRFTATTLLGESGRATLALMAKGGVDAAMLLTLLQHGALPQGLYTAAVTVLVASTIISSAYARPAQRAREVWRVRMRELPLDKAVVYYREPAIHAARIVARKSAAVVVDEEYRPVGYIVADDLVEMDPSLLERLPTLIFSRPEVPVVNADDLVAEVLSDPAIVHEPILAIVDREGVLVGTITPKDILEYIMRSGRGSGSGRAPHSRSGSD